MRINTRNLVIVAVTVLMLAACGEEGAPPSTAGKAPQKPAEPAAAMVPAPAAEPAAETPSAPATAAETVAAAAPPRAEALSHHVVYEEEIYKNWPYTEAPAPAAADIETIPPPAVLSHPVVYQEEIYKNWPYTAAPPPAVQPAVSEVVEEKMAAMESMVTGATEKVETAAAAVEEKMETAAAAVTGQPQQAAAGAAQTHTINAEARVFNSDIVYIQPGDTVSWTNMTSHNSVSIDGLIPAGATPWRGQLGENLKVTLTVEGIYGYVCEPHIGFGMIGVIVVGKPKDLKEVKAWADKNLQGPFRRILGKLNKVTIQ